MKKIELLIELAGETGLDGLVAQLQQFNFPDAFESIDAVALDPPAEELTELLQQLVRRALDPRLVGALLSHFEGRPLERGLIAWDVLAQSVWPQDEDEVFGQLQEALAEVRDYVPEPIDRGLDLNKWSAEKILDAMHKAHPPGDLSEGLGAVQLSAIHAARLGGGKAAALVNGPAIAGAVTSMGRLFSLAHLPTLASLYLDYATRTLGERAAARELCDAMFDANASARLPGEAIKKGDAPDGELEDLLEYTLYRAKIDIGQSIDALSILKTNRKTRPIGPLASACWADLAIRLGDDGPPREVLEAACKAHELWRYGWRARVALEAKHVDQRGQAPLDLCVDFTSRFGNAWRCWYDAFQASPGPKDWKLGACGFLGREVMTLPHDANAWKALVFLVASDDEEVAPLINEIEAHLYDQTEADE